MKKLIITLIIIFIVIGLGAGAAYWYRTNRKNTNPVNVYSVSNWVGNYYENEQTMSGNVVVSDEQNIYIDTERQVKEIYASPGDSVSVGDVILEYDNTQDVLRLNTMKANLEVAVTNLRLAQNQLAKLNNVTPIGDDEEIPKTEAELKLEEAEKALDEANEKLIAPSVELEEANEQVKAAEEQKEAKQGLLDDAAKAKAAAEKDLDAFYKKYSIATMTDAPEAEPRSDEDIKSDIYKLDKDANIEYGDVHGKYENAVKELQNKQDDYNKANDEYNKAVENHTLKENAYNEATKKVEEAQKAVDEATEAVSKEYEEQMENPTIVYTKSELERAIRTKNEEIRDLKLEIENQKLSIKKQEKAIEKSKVLSEYDGVVRFMEVNDETMSGISPAIIVSASGTYSAVVNVDEYSLSEMQIGEEVSILSYDTGNTYYGKVSKLSENPQEGGSYENVASVYPVTVVIEDSDDLSEGNWVEVSTMGRTSTDELTNQIVLPLALCKKENNSYYVMKKDKGRLKKQYISTGKIYYGQMIVVKGGITASDSIAFPYDKEAVEGKICKDADMSDLYDYY